MEMKEGRLIGKNGSVRREDSRRKIRYERKLRRGDPDRE